MHKSVKNVEFVRTVKIVNTLSKKAKMHPCEKKSEIDQTV